MLKLRWIINFDVMFFIFAGYLIIKGILRREDSYLTAETGVGYMLGIVGASMMLVLLLYPLRKHSRFMRNLGPVKYWFRLHMLLGVAGPVLILYHSNFSLGSTNSNIALICMLVVAGSGLLGRLFYIKIHDGLYGRKVELAELKSVLKDIKSDVNSENDMSDVLVAYEHAALKHRNLLSALFMMPYIHINSHLKRKNYINQITSALDKNEETLDKITITEKLTEYFKLLVRVSDFTVYERLFALWHVLHIPLFIMMIVSGIVHVIAVHVY